MPKLLLHRGVSLLTGIVQCKDYEWWKSTAGNIDIVKLLIEKCGCDPNVMTESNESLMHYACQYGDIDVQSLLVTMMNSQRTKEMVMASFQED